VHEPGKRGDVPALGKKRWDKKRGGGEELPSPERIESRKKKKKRVKMKRGENDILDLVGEKSSKSDHIRGAGKLEKGRKHLQCIRWGENP